MHSLEEVARTSDRRDGRLEPIECFAPPLGVRLPLRVASTEIEFERGSRASARQEDAFTLVVAKIGEIG